MRRDSGRWRRMMSTGEVSHGVRIKNSFSSHLCPCYLLFGLESHKNSKKMYVLSDGLDHSHKRRRSE